MAYTAKEFTEDEAIRRVWDEEEIENLINRFAYCEASNEREKALNELWVAEPANIATASFGRNWGFQLGMDAIRKYYVENNLFGAAGTTVMNPYSTQLVVIADDGNTAKGLWMILGYDTLPDSEGKLSGEWLNSRIAVDFIKESGKWKIWHLFIGTNFVLKAGTKYTDQPVLTKTRACGEGNAAWYTVGSGREVMVEDYALFDQIVEYPEREAFLKDVTIADDVYTARYNDQIFFPQLPSPYTTYDPDDGYDYKGFIRAKKQNEGRWNS